MNTDPAATQTLIKIAPLSSTDTLPLTCDGTAAAAYKVFGYPEYCSSIYSIVEAVLIHVQWGRGGGVAGWCTESYSGYGWQVFLSYGPVARRPSVIDHPDGRIKQISQRHAFKIRCKFGMNS